MTASYHYYVDTGEYAGVGEPITGDPNVAATTTPPPADTAAPFWTGTAWDLAPSTETPTQRTNRRSIEDALRAVLSNNRAYVQRPNSEKTAAVVRDQVDELTRQVNRLVRLQLRQLDSTT